jgi:hypothetical protein
MSILTERIERSLPLGCFILFIKICLLLKYEKISHPITATNNEKAGPVFLALPGKSLFRFFGSFVCQSESTAFCDCLILRAFNVKFSHFWVEFAEMDRLIMLDELSS